jgi:hypothetical protein
MQATTFSIGKSRYINDSELEAFLHQVRPYLKTMFWLKKFNPKDKFLQARSL